MTKPLRSRLGALPLQIALACVAPLTGPLNAAAAKLNYLSARKQSFNPRPDDIFIVSYAKSGTTLMQMMLHQLTSDGEMDFPHIECVSPWFEQTLLAGGAAVLDGLKSPRLFKSHLTYGLMPRHGKKIYLTRDLCDVAVSTYHHMCMVMGYDLPRDRFLRDFAAGRVMIGSWFRHTASWWPHRDDPDVLFLRYEDVVGDLAGAARRVAAFCGAPLREEDLPRIVERCSLAYMKERQAQFDPRLRWVALCPRPQFIRKGEVGAGTREITAEQRALLDRQLSELAGRLGCLPGDLFAPGGGPLEDRAGA